MPSALKLGGPRGPELLSPSLLPQAEPQPSSMPSPLHACAAGLGRPILTLARTDPSWSKPLSWLQSRVWAGAWV